uniref:Uncharacterized protein n=1 Tax=Arundo donax TaxID=35708 RepID=A0A0A9FR59_ARUDO
MCECNVKIIVFTSLFFFAFLFETFICIFRQLHACLKVYSTESLIDCRCSLPYDHSSFLR